MFKVVEVYTDNQNLDERPYSFGIDMDMPIMDRIRELSAAVKAVGGYTISEFCSAGEWSESMADDLPEEDETAYYDVAASSVRMDAVILHVTEGKFKFSGYPKHGGGDTRVDTEMMDISDLPS